MRHVSLIAAYNPAGDMLFGRRNDNGKWTLPGGHANPGESADKCAVRELMEETGLAPVELTRLDERTIRDGELAITTYKAEVNGIPTGKNDPDAECSEWHWIDVTDGVPSYILDNIHGPQSDGDNVVLSLFGMNKRRSEIDRLLENEDPAEQMMALRLDGVGPHHVMRTLDGDPDVAAVALSTPAATSEVLHSAVKRLPLRHVVMNLPHVTPDHLRAAFDASRGQPDADDIVHTILNHPLKDEGLLRYLWLNGIRSPELLRQDQFPADALDDAYLSGPADTKLLAMGHPNVRPEHVADALVHGTGDLQLLAASSPNVPAEAARDVLQRGHLVTDEAQAEVRRALIRNPALPREVVQVALHDLNPHVKLAALGRLQPWGLAKKEDTADVSQQPLTIRGKALKPKNVDKPTFDEKKGVLHTPRGSFPMYIPSRDSEQAKTSFHNIMNDPKVNQFHDYAMQNWTKVNSALKAGKLPPEVVMHATLFSQLSPNTPVPVQELMYGHLVDSMNHTGVDARSPEFADKVQQDWLDRDSGTKAPDVSPEHWERLGNQIRIKTKEAKRPKGQLMSFMLANNKFENMAKYHKLHNQLTDLVSRHRDNARAAVAELMIHKRLAGNHENVRKRHLAEGKPDIGEYTAGPAVNGLAPKTARYTYGMMGGSNVHVPDTHFTRYLFGLEKGKDNDTISYLKDLLWNEGNSHILDGIDRHYAQHHDAVQHMMQHPVWGKHFSKPEDAIFPAFWKNWVGIAPHEKARGLQTNAFNETTDHRPYWDVIRPFLKKTESTQSLPERTARQHADWAQEYGEPAAMMLYYRHLVPMLLGEQKHLVKMAIADITPGRKTSPPADAKVTPGKWHDYSHVLTPEHRTAGYTMYVHHVPQMPKQRDVLSAKLYHGTAEIGAVDGQVGTDGLQVDSSLADEHQGKGLGRAMYEAAYAHAHHSGVTHVVGHDPSSQAQLVHESLARRHGMKYKLKWQGAGELDGAEEAHSRYRYAIKSELTKAERTQDAIVADMLGRNGQLDDALHAAKFLAGGKPHDEAKLRQALWEHDGDHDKAALHVHGLEINEKNLRALKGLKGLSQLRKADEQPVKLGDVKAALLSGQDVAEAIQRASAGDNIRPIKLGGKHSAGTLLATDPKSGQAWLLKPGAGPQGPQLGANEQPASQSEREAAFYHVVENWGIGGYYPRSELLVIDGHQYAALQMLDPSYQNFNDICEAHPALPRHLFHPYLKNGIMFKWAIADWVLGQPDRNKGNVMAKLQQSTEGLEELPNVGEAEPVRLIDEGSAVDGVDFDPAHDRYSFVPYYLRASFDGNFNQLTGDEKLAHLPSLDGETEKLVRQWLDTLDEHKMADILREYHATPDACQMRLAQLKALVATMPVDQVINQLWALGNATPKPEAQPDPVQPQEAPVAKTEPLLSPVASIKEVAEALVKFRMADAPVDDRAILRMYGIAEADLRPSELFPTDEPKAE